MKILSIFLPYLYILWCAASDYSSEEIFLSDSGEDADYSPTDDVNNFPVFENPRQGNIHPGSLGDVQLSPFILYTELEPGEVWYFEASPFGDMYLCRKTMQPWAMRKKGLCINMEFYLHLKIFSLTSIPLAHSELEPVDGETLTFIISVPHRFDVNKKYYVALDQSIESEPTHKALKLSEYASDALHFKAKHVDFSRTENHGMCSFRIFHEKVGVFDAESCKWNNGRERLDQELLVLHNDRISKLLDFSNTFTVRYVGDALTLNFEQIESLQKVGGARYQRLETNITPNGQIYLSVKVKNNREFLLIPNQEKGFTFLLKDPNNLEMQLLTNDAFLGFKDYRALDVTEANALLAVKSEIEQKYNLNKKDL